MVIIFNFLDMRDFMQVLDHVRLVPTGKMRIVCANFIRLMLVAKLANLHFKITHCASFVFYPLHFNAACLSENS